MKTIALFLAVIGCAHGKAVPNSQIAQNYAATIDSIIGLFNPESLGYGTTSLANIAHTSETSQTISFSFFPVNYCQAVRICAPPNLEFSVDNPMILEESWCETQLFFSPASGKLETKDGAEVIKGYVDQLVFRRGDSFHELFVSDDPFTRTQLFSPKPYQTKIFKNKLLVILTNSRQCQVNVNIDGVLRYSDLLTQDRTALPTELPKKFKYAGSANELPTFYTDTSVGQQRRQDFLPHIKELTKTSKKLGNIQFSCQLGSGSDNRRSIVAKPSFVHVTKQELRTAGNPNSLTREKITIEVNNCHWMRLWFTKEGVKWSDYANKIGAEIHQTIDLFFNEGFVLLPDRENSVRLPGGAQEIKTMTILHHDGGLGEISFGTLGTDPINLINFKLDILKEKQYEVFIIRSPYCDANFGSDGVSNGMFGSGSGAKILNKIVFKKCEINSIQKA